MPDHRETLCRSRVAALYRSWGKPAEAARYQAALSGTSDSPAAARTP